MRKILASIFFMALAGTLSIAAPRQDQDDRHDNGKHKGWDKHEDRDDRDRHDNGKHKGWDNPHNPHANWDSEHDRFEPGGGKLRSGPLPRLGMGPRSRLCV